MALKTIYQDPSVTDSVVIPILTPDVNDCFLANPYMVNNLIIYYIERDFSGGNVIEYDIVQVNAAAKAAATKAQQIACVTPTIANITAAQKLKTQADALSITSPVYYNEATPVAVIGNAKFPAWLSSDLPNAFLTNIPTDGNGNPIYGNFQYTWTPTGMREGNYIACWTWTLHPAGETMSANLPFSLMGNTAITTSIPTHITPPDKYDVLLERYLPEMYKNFISTDDVTPTILDKFNKSVASGFTTLENLGNQILDIIDANATDEAFLGLLARMFALNLRSNDPTRWRRQIRQAVPLYKKKGTKQGLYEAFGLAGMQVNRLVRMWQIISPYSWVEAYKATEGQTEFVLSRVALSIDPENFEVSVRRNGTDNYVTYSDADVSIVTNNGISTLNIVGGISLGDGDIFKVLYQYVAIQNTTQQDIENYIRLLPLADQRDETLQTYPDKNWNVRVIEEDDPLFSILIPVRNPYHDSLVFGKIRTEFPYSENVYNMDEYNGSIRDSKSPCDIDKDFLDPCGQCLGSKFLIDVQVDNLSDDRIMEAKDIINEFMPFHAVPHAINFSGSVTDLVQPPVETIECLIYYKGQETVISGDAQLVFNRAMINNGIPLTQVFRDTLANSALVASGTGIAYNNYISIFSPNVALSEVGLSKNPSETVLHIFGPHPHAGTYQVANAVNHSAHIYEPIAPTTNPTEPINQSAFSFALSNTQYSNSNTSIVPNNIYTLLDTTWNLSEIEVKTQWDVDNGYATSPWTIKLTAYSATPYVIQKTMPNGALLIKQDPTLPLSNATHVSYSILRPDNSIAHTGVLNLNVDLRGIVTIGDVTLTDVRTIVDLGGKFFLYYTLSGVQYPIVGFVSETTNQFYISGWAGGSVGGVEISIYQRLVDTQYGLLTYQGMSIQTPVNYETGLSISNGNNPILVPLENSSFKENFLIVINDPAHGANNELFGFAEINRTTITLEGDIHYWTTLMNAGTSVPYQIFQYTTVPVTVSGTPFQRLDRRGAEVITSTIETSSPMAIAPFAMTSIPEPSGVSDTVRQEENIAFRIEYADGRTEEGNI